MVDGAEGQAVLPAAAEICDLNILQEEKQQSEAAQRVAVGGLGAPLRPRSLGSDSGTSAAASSSLSRHGASTER